MIISKQRIVDEYRTLCTQLQHEPALQRVADLFGIAEETVADTLDEVLHCAEQTLC